MAFAVTTYVEEVRIAVKGNSGITGIKDLNGKTIVTTTGTTSVQTLRKNKRADGLTFKEVMGKDHADSFLMLETGRADAFIMDGSILAANISKSKAPADYKIVGETLSVEPIACMLRRTTPPSRRPWTTPSSARSPTARWPSSMTSGSCSRFPGQREGRPAAVRRHQGRMGQPQRQAHGVVRSQVSTS